MPRPDRSFRLPTPAFVALSQEQAALVVDGLKADWCAIYLISRNAIETKPVLIPIAAYPKSNSLEAAKIERALLPSINESEGNISLQSRAAEEVFKFDIPHSQEQSSREQEQDPIIFRFIKNEKGEILGLLVARYASRPWKHEQLTQIDRAVNIISIAYGLDQQQSQREQQATVQSQLRDLEKARMDDLLHQLRNPLTALRTFSKLLLKRLLPSDKGHSIVQSMLRESDRLQELLQSFETELDVIETEAKVIMGETTVTQTTEESSSSNSSSSPLLPIPRLKLTSIYVSEVLAPLIISQSVIAAERNIKLSVEIPEKLAQVIANTKALTEVLSNLIDNALKYTPKQGLVVVKAGLRKTTGEMHWQGIAIEDTGDGIPPKDHEHIFERHFRGIQEKSNVSGNGLGLAIVKELIERMEGKIDLVSPNGLSEKETHPGTTMIIWLAEIP